MNASFGPKLKIKLEDWPSFQTWEEASKEWKEKFRNPDERKSATWQEASKQWDEENKETLMLQ